MGLKSDLRMAVEQGDLEKVEAIVSKEKKAIRYLAGMIYGLDEEKRQIASKGIAIAAKYHLKMVEKVVERIVWAMDSKSGTNAVEVPEILKAIAKEQPKLLIPMVPEMARLAMGDSSMHKGIQEAIRLVGLDYPEEVNRKLSKALRERMMRGDCGR